MKPIPGKIIDNPGIKSGKQYSNKRISARSKLLPETESQVYVVSPDYKDVFDYFADTFEFAILHPEMALKEIMKLKLNPEKVLKIKGVLNDAK